MNILKTKYSLILVQDACPLNVTVSPLYGSNQWNLTSGGSTAYSLCYYGAPFTGAPGNNASRFCMMNGQWSAPNYTNCRDSKLMFFFPNLTASFYCL